MVLTVGFPRVYTGVRPRVGGRGLAGRNYRVICTTRFVSVRSLIRRRSAPRVLDGYFFVPDGAARRANPRIRRTRLRLHSAAAADPQVVSSRERDSPPRLTRRRRQTSECRLQKDFTCDNPPAGSVRKGRGGAPTRVILGRRGGGVGGVGRRSLFEHVGAAVIDYRELLK